MITALIWPYNAVSEGFVRHMESLTRRSKMALDKKLAAQEREETTEKTP